MDAREYLGKLRKLRSIIKTLTKQIEEAEYSFFKNADNGDAVRVQTSLRLEANYEEDVIKLADLQRERSSKVVAYEQELSEITDMIYLVDSADHLKEKRNKIKYCEVIYDRWVKDKCLEQIAYEQDRSLRQIKRIYRDAMIAMQEILDRKKIKLYQ